MMYADFFAEQSNCYIYDEILQTMTCGGVERLNCSFYADRRSKGCSAKMPPGECTSNYTCAFDPPG